MTTNDSVSDRQVTLPPRIDISDGPPPPPREEVDPLYWSFREVEANLAACYGIASTKRQTFASRLKHFHRLKFPLGFMPEHGKVARYSSGDMAMMALALEMTNLGLLPERIVRVLTAEWYPTTTALGTAASWLLMNDCRGFDAEVQRPDTDPSSMFVFFDASALAPLTTELDLRVAPDCDDAANSFFYGGEGVVRDNLVKWTSGYVSRVSLVNVTSMLDRLVWFDASQYSPEQTAVYQDYRRRFFLNVQYWAEDFAARHFSDDAAAEAKLAYLDAFFSFCVVVPDNPTPEQLRAIVDMVQDYTNMNYESVEEALTSFAIRQKGGKRNVR